jgi:hypothetical protein
VFVSSESKETGKKKCPVPSCSTYSSIKRGCFYSVPDHPIRRQAWIDALKLPNDCYSGTSICWKHFQDSDFVKEIITLTDIAECTFGQLKKNAIPTLCLPDDSNKNSVDSSSLIQDLIINETLEAENSLKNTGLKRKNTKKPSMSESKKGTMVCCQACGSYFEDISALSNHFEMRLQCRTKGNYDLFKMHGNYSTLPIPLPMQDQFPVSMSNSLPTPFPVSAQFPYSNFQVRHKGQIKTEGFVPIKSEVNNFENTGSFEGHSSLEYDPLAL